MTLLILRTREPIPAVNALAGDLVLIDPYDSDNPLALYRSLPAETLPSLLQHLDEMEVVQSAEPERLQVMESENGHRSVLQTLRRRGLIA